MLAWKTRDKVKQLGGEVQIVVEINLHIKWGHKAEELNQKWTRKGIVMFNGWGGKIFNIQR